MNEALFPLGKLLITPEALIELLAAGLQPLHLLSRHERGDWGEMDSIDQAANHSAMREGLRIISMFHIKEDVEVYVVTEGDRSATTILLAEEY